MTSPGRSAAMSAVAVVLIGYIILSAHERPSTFLAGLQYVLLAAAIIGLIGSLAKIGKS